MMKKYIFFIILLLNIQGLSAQSSGDLQSILNIEKEFRSAYKSNSGILKQASASSSRLDSVLVFENQYLDHNVLDLKKVQHYSYSSGDKLEGIEILHYGAEIWDTLEILMKESFTFDDLGRLSTHGIGRDNGSRSIWPDELCLPPRNTNCFDSISTSFEYDGHLKWEISDCCRLNWNQTGYLWDCGTQASKEYSYDEEGRINRILYEGYERREVFSENFTYSPEGKLRYYFIYSEPPYEERTPGELKKYTTSGSGDTIIFHIQRGGYSSNVSPESVKSWQNTSRYRSYYQPDQRLEILIKADSSAATMGEFIEDVRFEYLHNDQGRLINKKIFRYEGFEEEWKLILEQDLVYNAQGDTLSEATAIWDDNYQTWKILSRREFHYSVQTRITPSFTKYNIKVYPNPASTFLYVNDPEAVSDYSILNGLGQLMAKGPLQSNTIDLADLDSGMYILLLHSSERQVMTRFVKY